MEERASKEARWWLVERWLADQIPWEPRPEVVWALGATRG